MSSQPSIRTNCLTQPPSPLLRSSKFLLRLLHRITLRSPMPHPYIPHALEGEKRKTLSTERGRRSALRDDWLTHAPPTPRTHSLPFSDGFGNHNHRRWNRRWNQLFFQSTAENAIAEWTGRFWSRLSFPSYWGLYPRSSPLAPTHGQALVRQASLLCAESIY